MEGEGKMNSVSNRFRQGVCLLLALLLVCLLGSACAADGPFYFTWPLVSGSWDYNFPVNVYTSQGDYWQNWEGKGAPYYNDYITYITGGYSTGEIADFLVNEDLGSAEIVAAGDGTYVGNVMVYPEQLRIDGVNYRLQALHSPEGGDDVLLDGGWYDRGNGWVYEGSWPASVSQAEWILIPDSVRTIYKLCRGFKNPVGIALPDNDQFSMYIEPSLSDHSPGVTFYVVQGSKAHQHCVEKNYPFRFRDPYENHVRKDSPAGIRIFDIDAYIAALEAVQPPASAATQPPAAPVAPTAAPDAGPAAPEIRQGATVTFGRYEQDNNFDNGKEPVEWTVLYVDQIGNRALLLSKYALDMQRYNEQWKKVSWKNCTVRSWLNGVFYASCFSSNEARAILDTDNRSFYVDGFVDTTDRVFFLSADEVRQFLPTDASRQAIPTAYAIAREIALDEENCYWWLRDSTTRKNDANRVRPHGNVEEYGGNTNAYGVGVRPALWISLDLF